MKLSRSFWVLAAFILLPCLPVQGLGESELLFTGYSRYAEGEPDAVGSIMEMYGILSSNTEVPAPIPLDPESYQYTVHLFNLRVTEYDNQLPTIKNIVFSDGFLRIYRDKLETGTPADYLMVNTMLDGDEILAAQVDADFTLLLFDFDLNFFFNGSGSGTGDFFAGERLIDLIDAGYFLQDWTFTADPVLDANPNPPFPVEVPPGFQRVFDLQLVPPNDPTTSTMASWGRVKKLYR